MDSGCKDSRAFALLLSPTNLSLSNSICNNIDHIQHGVLDELDGSRERSHRYRRYSDTYLSRPKRRRDRLRPSSFAIYRDEPTVKASALYRSSHRILSQRASVDHYATSVLHSALASPAASDSAICSTAANSPLPSPSAIESPYYREDVLKPRHIQIDPLGDSIPANIGRFLRQNILRPSTSPRPSLELTDEQCRAFQQELSAALNGEIEDHARAHNSFVGFLFPSLLIPEDLSIGGDLRTRDSALSSSSPRTEENVYSRHEEEC